MCMCVCVCVRVCVCVCVTVCMCRVLQLLNNIHEVKVSVSIIIGFYSHDHVCNLWICKIMLRSRVTVRFAYLECLCSLFRTTM